MWVAQALLHQGVTDAPDHAAEQLRARCAGVQDAASSESTGHVRDADVACEFIHGNASELSSKGHACVLALAEEPSADAFDCQAVEAGACQHDRSLLGASMFDAMLHIAPAKHDVAERALIQRAAAVDTRKPGESPGEFVCGLHQR